MIQLSVGFMADYSKRFGIDPQTPIRNSIIEDRLHQDDRQNVSIDQPQRKKSRPFGRN